jgi:Big-like domain-containing protein/calcineurin-like phosphoesterase family protein/purple acid phosphatase-like protein/immunoglobulin I-set domain protein
MKTAALLLAAAAVSYSALAATVPPSGYNNDFGVQPPAEDWATTTIAGNAQDDYVVDTDVNANITAEGVTAQTTSNGAVPAQQMGPATWSSVGFYLQTRPTGNRYTVLMGKFVNDTGTNATEVRASYLFTIAAGGVVEEAGRGNRVYYSRTGLAGSWINVPAFNTTSSTEASTPVSTTIAVDWPQGTILYLVWADDNATGQGTDAGNQIDDFALQVTAGMPLSTALTATLTAPANDSVLVSGPVSATTQVTLGTPPYTVEYFLSAGAGNTTFSSVGSSGSLGTLSAGTYNVYAVATDSATPAASTNTMTNTFLVADAITLTLDSPANGAIFDNTTSVTGTASIIGGTSPYSVQFYLDNVATGLLLTSSPYERNFGALFVGDHTIRATVTDSRGWVSNSAIHTVHITGPLGVTLTPTNGASFVFGEAITLVAAPGGGTGPYTLTFYTNNEVAGAGGTAPSLHLGMLPVGTYSSYVHVVDSVSAQADSSVNTFTVLPNPITVGLTAPTNGQSAFPGATLALAATATVGAPLTITNVQFFYDGTLAGTDTSTPYSGSVANLVQGNRTVYAVATDNLGRQSFSTTNQITVTAPPGSNDNFANAIPLFGPVVTTTGNNTTATRQGGFQGEPFHGGNFGGASVWWTWTATASGPTTIDTLGSDFNTLLGVYVGNAVNQLTTIAGNNDFEGNPWSRVQFNAVGGTLYRIAVDGFSPGFPPNPARGNIVLNIKGVGGVEITSPSNGTVFTLGEPIPVSVGITPDFPNPPATRVDFYVGSTLFASSDTAPFSATATNVPAGSNTIYAVAISSTGQPIQSPVVRIFVQKIGVTILTPFEDTVFQSTNPITVTAWSYLPSGSITNIEFFVDGVKFGEDTDLPFAATWTSVTPGSHRITAIGRSDAGVTYNSQPVNIGVAAVLVPFASVWKYLDNGSDQGTPWIAPDFDDTSWGSGPAPLGYSDSMGRLPATTNSFGPDMNLKYPTTYYRQAFVASNVASFSSILLSIERDDGAVVHLNGAELARFNMPTGAVNYANYSGMLAQDDGVTVFNLNVNPSLLLEGTNIFAVSIHQESGSSSDIWFQMRLMGVPTIIHNLSPLVSITNPTSGQYFLAPSSITLEAEASDPDGSVAKVQFFDNGFVIGEATSAPYSVVWNNPSVAARTLTAVATDDLGATTRSAEVPIVVYDAVGTPVAAITSPADGAVMEGPTNLLITATANAINGVTNVQFLADGIEFGNDTTFPYSAIWTAPFGTSVLSAVVFDANGVTGTSPLVTVTITIPPTNVIAPTILRQSPLAGSTVTNLTNITVSFSEYVQNVYATNLLINGVPAATVNANHSRSNYTFSFAQPPYGQVNVTWASGHAITDYGWPTVLPFDENGEGASWTYTLIDATPPTIVARTPAPNSTVTNLHEITVVFSEPVTGVDASDLMVNGGPAFEVIGSGTTYTFEVSQPASGTVNVTWSTNNNIFDTAVTPNAFNRAAPGAAWSFTLDARTVLVQSNSMWRSFKGTYEASFPVDAWRQLNFDHSEWSNSPAPFFFGDPYTNALIRGTLLNDMLSNYTSIYLRQEFMVHGRGNITSLLLNAQSDDGFIAWINGVEVRRYNVPAGEPTYRTVASSAAPEPQNAGAAYIVATLPAAAVAALIDGTNVLAVQAFNQNLTNSTDFGFNAQLYTFPIEPGTVPPRLLAPAPPPGDLLYLTNITITFSEPVSGVDATDLLINGNPATGMETSTNTTYKFGFAQPPYGIVSITWDTNHNIVDFDGPPKAFNGTNAGSTFTYTLINPSNPRVLTQTPLAGSTVTGLTAVVVTFTEPVSGVDASDFLVSGAPAASVSSADGTTYNFSFTQPAFGNVSIRWDLDHGIADVEAGNPFDQTRFGGQWNYTLVDPAPSVTITTPTNNSYRLQPATVAVTATASDNDGTVARVQFYQGANLFGEATNAPYTATISNLAVGVYTLRAIATDNMGLMGTSAPVVLNVVTSLPAALVRGPYLQIGTPTSGIVRWRTDVQTDAIVYYGTDPERLTNIASELTLTNEHIVQISGLQPSTRYYYSIGSGAYRLAGTNGIGSDYWFDTSPPVGTRKPIRLWVLGDAGTAGNGAPDRQQSTRNAFYNYAATNGQPDIWLMLGDNAYNSGTDVEHQRAIFDMYPATLRTKFLWPTLGNHETAMSTTATDFPYLHIFSLPRDGEAGGISSGTEKYYSFDYGNIHFVCLDSMTSGQTGNTPMANWLRQDLESATAEWVIVFFHHPPYTKGNHDSDREQDLVNIRQNLVPILESNGVDLVLCGHSHAWERSYFIHGHYGLSSTFNDSMKVDPGDGREDGDGAYRKNAAGQGVIYTVAGNAGQVTGGSLNHAANFLSLNELGTMVIDVNENRLDAIFLRENGEIDDHFTLSKPDPRPVAPANLLALPSGPTGVTLEWADMSGNESGFLIERSLDGVHFSQQLTAAANTMTAVDSGLEASVPYYYRVRATNDLFVSEYSNIASVTPGDATSAPQAPANLIAISDDGIRFYRSQMILSWTDRSSDEGAFQIERSQDGLLFVPVATVAANVTSYLDRGLESASYYVYRVRAVNSAGLSGPSNFGADQTHPQSQLVRAGESVSFHAGVEGLPGVRYQWRFMSSILTGETNETLTLAAAQESNQGEYSVDITEAGRTSPRTSNPATLVVVSPPRIVSQPQDSARAVGMTAQFAVGMEGTPPFTYHWRKNGAPIGISAAVLALPGVGFGDQGGYDVVVENNFGSVASRVATLRVYALPTLAPVPDLFAEVLKPITVTNVATDENVPPLNLRFVLGTGAPTNAYLNPLTGVFRWTPNRFQAPSMNAIIVAVYDPAQSFLSNSISFNIRVNDYAELSLGSAIVLANSNGIVPINLFSSLPLSEVQTVLNFAGEYFSDVTLEQPGVQSATALFQRLDPNSAALTLTAPSGGSFIGSNQPAMLRVVTRPLTNSTAVPFRVTSLNATTSGGTSSESPPTLLATHGQVIVVGSRPLLESHFTAQGARELTLYARPGTYALQWSTNLVDPVWRNRGNVVINSNLFNLIRPANNPPTNFPGFFRTRQ